jgi:hypothetical protein
VPTGKFAPPLGANQPVLETIANESPAKAVISGFAGTRNTIPYPPTSITVPLGKEYRTARQRIPYRPAKNTVPPGKEYRTARQNIAYSPAKLVRDAPAKRAKTVGRRFVRPVFVSC